MPGRIAMQDPKPPSSVPAPVGLTIECDVCHSRASFYVSPADEFFQRQSIERYCSKCVTTTLWRENKRQEMRLRMNMAACIRFRGVDQEVLQPEDVSRGGLCFTSRHVYIEGCRIEVAVPYTPGGVNIFSEYRILAAQKPERSNLIRYHAKIIGMALAS